MKYTTLVLSILLIFPLTCISQVDEQLLHDAEAGNAVAQIDLGWMYEAGEGVPQDYSEAVKWFRMAAEQGDAHAEASLGVMYDHGHGVSQDISEAYVWYSVATSNGSRTAAHRRDVVAGKLSPQALVAAQKRAEMLIEEIKARKAK